MDEDTGNTQVAEAQESGSLLSGGEQDAPAQPAEQPSAQTTPNPFGFYTDDGLNMDALNALPEEAKTFKNLLQKYKDPQGFYQGLDHLNYMARGKGLQELPENATDEQREAWTKSVRGALGIPDSVDEYDVAMPEDLPDSMHVDDAYLASMKKVAHENNISPQAFSALVQAQAEYAKSLPNEEAIQAQEMEEQRGVLSKEYGGDLPQVLERAKRGAGILGIEPSSPIFNTADGVKAAAKIAELMGEDSSIDGNNAAAMAAQQHIDAYRAVFTDPNNAIYKLLHSSDPQQQAEGIRRREQLARTAKTYGYKS